MEQPSTCDHTCEWQEIATVAVGAVGTVGVANAKTKSWEIL